MSKEEPIEMTELNESLTFRRGLRIKNKVVMAPMTTSMSSFERLHRDVHLLI